MGTNQSMYQNSAQTWAGSAFVNPCSGTAASLNIYWTTVQFGCLGHLNLTTWQVYLRVVRLKWLWAIKPVHFTSLSFKTGRCKRGNLSCQPFNTLLRLIPPLLPATARIKEDPDPAADSVWGIWGSFQGSIWACPKPEFIGLYPSLLISSRL